MTRRGQILLTVAAVLLAACRQPPPPIPSTCSISFDDQGSVRLFVVGHRFSLSDADGADAYDASIRRHLAAIQPCLSTSRPNLVVFPENVGLVTWFLGRRGLYARNVSDSATAFNALYAGLFRAADEYRSRFPGISPARALELAASDPAWRAMDRTFGGLARDTGAWVMASANLPVSHRSRAGRDDVLRDPDAPWGDETYVADGPEVFNAALLYGPDGALAGRIDKAYLIDTETTLLDLSHGPLATLQAFETPFGRIGAAISRDAFYAPFMQRAEDLGVELMIQPEAFSGWTTPTEHPDEWSPDHFMASSWSHTQKYRGLRYSAVPVLAGDLYETLFDGQVSIARKATPADAPLGYVGNAPSGGFLAVGPWSFEDPVELPEGDRRAQLRALGGEGWYTDSLVAADLHLHGDGPAPPIPVTSSGAGVALAPVAPSISPQTNPDLAYDSAGRLYVAWTEGGQVWIATSTSDGRTFSPARAVSQSTGTQRRPAVAAGSPGEVLVAWQEGTPERLHVARSTDAAATFTSGPVEPSATFAQWEPALAMPAGGGRAAVAWTDFRDGLAPRIRWSRFDAASGGWTAAELVDPSGPEPSRIAGTQVQPSLSWGDGPLTAAWLDYRTIDWRVRAASLDATGSAASEEISPPSPLEHLHSDPRLVAAGAQAVIAVWDDLRQRTGHHDVRGAVLRPGSGWQPLPPMAGESGARAPSSRFRPAVAARGSAALLVFQDLAPGKNALGWARVELTAAPPPPELDALRLDDTGSSANQLTRPRVAVRPGSGVAVAVVEDDRSGVSQVRITEPF